MGAFDFDFDWGPHQMPVFGGFFKNPDQEAQLQAFAEAAKQAQAYRPEMAAAQNRSLQNQLSAYQPANNALGQMYGLDAQVDLEQAGQQVMSPEMMGIGMEPPETKTGKHQKKMSKKGGMIGLGAFGPIGALFGAGIGSTRGKKKDKKAKK